MAKADGSNIQKQFLDKLATSQTQVRGLAEQLGTTLDAITSDDVNGQALAAAALFQANVTPVVTVRIAFGGDNHTDAALQAEADQHVSGVAGIQTMMNAMATAGLADKVTFATMNVFGRNLSGIAKVDGRTGRDHYGNHSVMVLIGKNVRPGVYGGVIPSGTSGAFAAGDIDSATGAQATGGDITAAEVPRVGGAHAGSGAGPARRPGRERLRRLGRRQGHHRRDREDARLARGPTLAENDRAEPGAGTLLVVRMRFAVLLTCAVAAAIAGCCGGGPNHKCDFTPPSETRTADQTLRFCAEPPSARRARSAAYQGARAGAVHQPGGLRAARLREAGASACTAPADCPPGRPAASTSAIQRLDDRLPAPQSSAPATGRTRACR